MAAIVVKKQFFMFKKTYLALLLIIFVGKSPKFLYYRFNDVFNIQTKIIRTMLFTYSTHSCRDLFVLLEYDTILIYIIPRTLTN